MDIRGWTTGRLAAAMRVGLLSLALAGEALAVEEILVTTRKREEPLQRVPIAVVAITAEEIQRQGINRLDDVVQQSASVILDQGFAPQDQRIVIRGLSPTRGRQNVAVLQDGIDVSSEAGAATAGGSLLINPRLFDLERVEIVKGPQIALFGRSAFAGAINYVTRRPGDEFRARVGTDIGSDGLIEVSGGIEGPLAAGLSGGIAAMLWTRDGFYTNTVTGQEVGEQEGTSIAGTLVWKLSDRFTATARIENLNDEFGVTPYVVLPFNAQFPIPSAAQQPFDPDGPGPIPEFPPLVSPTLTSVAGITGKVPDGKTFVVAVSEDPRTCRDPTVTDARAGGCSNYAGSERDITRGTLTLEWDLERFSFTSLTHYADAFTGQAEGAEDVSAVASPTPADFFLDQDTKLFSQELRLASSGEGRLKWLAGGLFWQEKVDVLDGSSTCLNYSFQPCGPFMAVQLPNAPLNVPDDGLTPLNPDLWVRDTDHWSLFALVEWEFIDNWKLTLEGRQTWEDLKVLGPDQDNGIYDPSGVLCTFFGVPPCPQPGPGTNAEGITTVANARGGKEDDQFFAPKVTVTWTPADNQLWYLSFAESFKPKGISTLLGGTGAFFSTACEANPACADPIASFRFRQEKLDNYELGAKTNWLDRRLQINGAVFFQDFKNKQVSTQVANEVTGILEPRILNAGAAEVWGLELDATWFATENLTLSLGYTWLDTEYTNYTANTTGAGTIAYAGNCTMDFSEVNGVVRRFCVVDYSGNELEGAPEHALVGNARWQAPLVGSTGYFVEGDFNYQDDRFASDKNLMVFPSYWLFNFRAGLSNDSWDVVAYVDNAFDDRTIRTGFEDGDIPTFFATNRFLNRGTLILPDPRTWGLRINYRFGR